MRLVETRIEQAAVDEARRMDKLLGYGEHELARWTQKIEPHHFSTVYCHERDTRYINICSIRLDGGVGNRMAVTLQSF